MEWSAEQEEAAQKKVQENSQPLPAEKQGSSIDCLLCFIVKTE